jgi:hypothetical protein
MTHHGWTLTAGSAFKVGWRSNGGRLINSAAPKGTNNVGVERDAVTSAKNLISNTWVGGRTALVAVGLGQFHSRDLSTATSGNSSGEP